MEEKIFLNRKHKAIGLIHKAFLINLKNKRNYTASTKTKSEVRGGGRKPWRQKGTGQARAGSTRSPLWVGGGVCFGPKPRTVNKKINKKERRLAILSGLYLKKNAFKFIDENTLNEITNVKTKTSIKFFSELSVNFDKKTLLIITKPNKNLWISLRNLKNVEITMANCLSLTHLLNANNILLSKESLELINQTYGNCYL